MLDKVTSRNIIMDISSRLQEGSTDFSGGQSGGSFNFYGLRPLPEKSIANQRDPFQPDENKPRARIYNMGMRVDVIA